MNISNFSFPEKKKLFLILSFIFTFLFYKPAITLSDQHIPPQEQQPTQTETIEYPSPKQIPSTQGTEIIAPQETQPSGGIKFPTKYEGTILPGKKDLDIEIIQPSDGTQLEQPITVPGVELPSKYTPIKPTEPIKEEAPTSTVFRVVVSDCDTNQLLTGVKVVVSFPGNKLTQRSNRDGVAEFPGIPPDINLVDLKVIMQGYKTVDTPNTNILVSTPDKICVGKSIVVSSPETPVVVSQPTDTSQPTVSTPTQPVITDGGDQTTQTPSQPTVSTPTQEQQPPVAQTPEKKEPPHHRLTDTTSSRGKKLIPMDPTPPVRYVEDSNTNEETTDKKISTVARLLEHQTTTTQRDHGKTRERDKEKITSVSEGLPPTATDDGPPTIYGEELEDEELSCMLVGNTVFFPLTTAYLKREQVYEAYNEPAVGAAGVLLHDKSLLYQPFDMVVKSVGLNFMFTRSYRSASNTEGGGLIGQKWDFNFNKTIFPLGGVLIPQFNLKAETQPGNVEYRNGTGRVDKLVAKEAEIRPVSNFGKKFFAHVTTYKSVPGLFAELERYALTLTVDPKNIPFSEHPNFEGRMFYVLRYKNGYQEVFNCRGQIIYAMDRHGALDPTSNVMIFKYKTPLNPLTQNPMLYEVRDTARRKYSIEHKKISSGLVNTNYYGKVINRSFPTMRIKKIIDPEGRTTEFKYGEGEGGPFIKEKIDTRDGRKFITKYKYGNDNLLETVTNVNDNEPYFTIKYSGSVVVSQSLGKTSGTYSRFGGPNGATYQIQGNTIIDPNGNRTKHQLVTINNYPVRKALIEETDSGQAKTVFDYNDDLQITKVVYPRANETTYEYDTSNGPMPAIGSVRDWRPYFTYQNDLSKGNLLKVTHKRKSVEHDLDYDEITISYEYEPRFNSITSIKGPGPQEEKRKYQHGSYGSAGDNGNPLNITFKRSRAEGGKLSQTFKYNKQGLTMSEDDGSEQKTYTYTKAGYITSITSPKVTTSFTNDARGNLTRFVNERGVLTTYEVNERDLTTNEILDAAITLFSRL